MFSASPVLFSFIYAVAYFNNESVHGLALHNVLCSVIFLSSECSESSKFPLSVFRRVSQMQRFICQYSGSECYAYALCYETIGKRHLSVVSYMVMLYSAELCLLS